MSNIKITKKEKGWNAVSVILSGAILISSMVLFIEYLIMYCQYHLTPFYYNIWNGKMLLSSNPEYFWFYIISIGLFVCLAGYNLFIRLKELSEVSNEENR